ncbi:MAG: TadE/TadG family type IV pilus assembly protein, partial [Nocardioidaceae bacterium]
MKRVTWRAPGAARRRSEGGYVAILTILLFTTLFGLCAFAVDVGNWYYTGQRAQRAADAGALAGVPLLPGDPSGAFAEARTFTKANGFDNSSSNVQVDTSIDGQPTRLRVTTSMTVQNQFGILFGLGHTTISRTAVADYAGPVPMGSPCNEFGNDPESTGIKSTNCADAGMFWANVGAPKAPKKSGD